MDARWYITEVENGLYTIGNAGKPNGGLMTWTGWDSAPAGASYVKV